MTDLEDLPAALGSIAADGGAVLNRRARALLRVASGGLEAAVAPADRAALAAAVAAARTGAEATVVVQVAASVAPDEPVEAPAPAGAVAAAPAELPRFVELLLVGAADGRVDVALTDVTERERTREVLRSVAISSWIIDDQARMVWGPIGHGLAIQHARVGTMADRIHPEDLSAASDAFLAAHEQPGVPCSASVRVRHAQVDGHWIGSRFQITNHLDDPRVNGYVVVTTDTTEPVAVASLARTSGSHLSVAEAAPVGIVLTGPKGLPLYYNEAAMTLLPGFGVRAGEDTLDRDWIRAAARGERAALRDDIETTLRTGAQSSRLALFVPTDGVERWLLVTISPRLVEDDRVIGLVTTFQDVSAEVRAKQELEAAQQRLVHLATHDPLTGLANRTLLADQLAASLDAGVGVLYGDLDGFKAVNDRLGHAAGDQLLALAAERLREVVAEVAPDALVARVGGDEFVIVVQAPAPATGGAVLDRLAVAVVDALGQPFRVGGADEQVAASVGLAIAVPGEDVDAVLGRADAAMYRAKAEGRGRRAWADPPG